MRTVARLLIALAVSLLAGLLLSPPASAAPWDCKDAPVPAMPDSGLPGFLDPRPNPMPPSGDPFAPTGRTTTIYDQYGYAGLSWSTYDLGCGGAMRDMGAAVDTTVGNAFMGAATWVSAATNGIHNRVAQPAQYMAPLDEVVDTVTRQIKDRIWTPWGGASIVAVAALLLLYSARGNLSAVTSAAAWAALVLVILAGVSEYPTRVATFFDQTVTSTLGAVNEAAVGVTPTPGSDPTRAQGALIVDQILYQAWLRGQFGDPTSATAQTYGPTMFRESTLSRAEAAQAATSPDGIAQLTEQKGTDWVATADQIGETDPVAYAAIQGKAGNRTGSGFMAFIGALFTGIFRMVADIFLFAGLFMLRLLTMFFPAAAVFALLAPLAEVVRRIGNIAGASIVNVTVFGIGASIHSVFIAAILSHSSTNGLGILTFILALVVTLAAFIMLLPYLTLTSILGRPSNGQAVLRRNVTRMSRRLRHRDPSYPTGDDDDEEEDEKRKTSTTNSQQGSSDRTTHGAARRMHAVIPEAYGRAASDPDDESDLAGDPTVVIHSDTVPIPVAETARTTARPHADPDAARPIPVTIPRAPREPDRVVIAEHIDRLPNQILERPVIHVHDSNAEIHSHGVGPQLYDPATKTVTPLPVAPGAGHD